MPDLLQSQHNDVIFHKFHAPDPCNWVAKKQIKKQNYSILSKFMNKTPFIAILEPQFGQAWSRRNE